MKRFTALYAALDATTATSRKLAALGEYFGDAEVSDADKAWALWLLIGNRLKRLIAPTRLREWVGSVTGYSAPIIEACYAQVGDLAETIALLLDQPGKREGEQRPLSEWIARLQALAAADEAAQQAELRAIWASLPREQCYLFNKLLTGSLRVGVSAGLAARAVAARFGLEPALIARRLAGSWQPSAETWRRLVAADESGLLDPAQPYPFCLASPLDEAPAAEGTSPPDSLGTVREFLAEWKWDGIRAQLIRRDGQCWVWSRGEELLNGRFPEVEAMAATLPEGTVLDGEILAGTPEQVLPFAVLQKRIGRKQVGRKLLAEAPVHFLAYDLLEWQGEDWRERPLAERRAQLQTLPIACSPALPAESWTQLAALREEARARGVEGLMLKRLASPYQTGRKRGHWWKWKLGALTVDTVLLYAQAGHGRRANLYTDYTLGVWQGEQLVPVAKAYSGLSDKELLEMDAWIRRHTREKFGPVRSVEPLQVFEIAFEGIQASSRHKAGVALRFPRIARWRRDKPAAEADTLESLQQLVRKP